jgi:hypothetical protein
MKKPLHPLCAAFPRYAGKKLHELAADIKENGQHDDVITLDDQVLDGQNRQDACEIAGVECRYSPFKGGDPVAFVISKNMKGRIISAANRALIAAKLSKWKLGQNQHTDGGSAPGPTQTEASEQMGVSPRSTRRAAKVINKSPALENMVASEAVGLKDAEALASLPDKKLEKALEDQTGGTAKKIAAQVRKREEAKRQKPSTLLMGQHAIYDRGHQTLAESGQTPEQHNAAVLDAYAPQPRAEAPRPTINADIFYTSVPSVPVEPPKVDVNAYLNLQVGKGVATIREAAEPKCRKCGRIRINADVDGSECPNCNPTAPASAPQPQGEAEALAPIVFEDGEDWRQGTTAEFRAAVVDLIEIAYQCVIRTTPKASHRAIVDDIKSALK